ncbi:hypothetical protein BJ875DRAFT_487641 [Amylocarpus encephaloides]|uniref:DUF7918 domain-containing protein n=1 Tax=Amylocarpus encephaloides TaxID=45428 RepID=A0A9P7YBB5_9HELO|nr:hypothetical protein BJ875DRAFT_487641 [Amylocarpus encephaloides]
MGLNSKIPGIEVTIIVDGKALKEYPAENEKSNNCNPDMVTHQNKCTATYFIEIQSEKNFAICLSVGAPYKLDCPKLEFRTFVNSEWIQAPCMTRTDFNNEAWSETVIGPAVKDGVSVRPMSFSKLKITPGLQWDVEMIKRQQEDMEQKSEIVVEEREIHEKSVLRKAISHSVTFCKEIEGFSSQKVKHNYIDGEDYMLATFVFKYRAKESVETLGVIPRSPSPERKPVVADIKTPRKRANKVQVPLKNKEKEEKVAKILAEIRGSDAKKVKREFSEFKEEDVEQPVIKAKGNGHESGGKSARKSFRRGEIIDLTGDD